MGGGIAAWIADARDTYFGNATAVRDYRVQLRGNRSVLLFGLYLLILIGVAMYVYSTSTNGYGTSIIEAQRRLRDFYQITMGLLGLTIAVVAPALTATAIVLERQRQSIDLIFSAPVTPKYFLVGKMISSFRYTWMLLVLALPVAAASVVLGGASWVDVLVAYLLLSFQGLILTAFALLMSSLAPKPVSAIIWSYLAAILYNAFSLSLGTAGAYAMRFARGANGEAPFYVGLSPWTATEAARTYTTIGTYPVPNWIFVLIIALLLTKICLLGAGTLLSASGGKEVIGLRFYGLIYTLAAATLAGWTIWPSALGLSRSSGAIELDSEAGMCGVLLSCVSGLLITFIPFLACYGFDREKRFQPNGLFNLKRILDGTPSGGFPFLIAFMFSVFGGFAVGGWANTKVWVSSGYWGIAFFAITFWTLFFSIGRFVSSFGQPLKNSRIITFSVFLLLVGLPFPLFAASSGVDFSRFTDPLWNFYILSPIIFRNGNNPGQAVPFSIIFLTLSVLMLAYGERRTKQKLSTIRNYDEQPFQAA